METITITGCLDVYKRQHSAVKTWSLTNAWPKKITVEGFKADGNSVAIDVYKRQWPMMHRDLQIRMYWNYL